MAKRLKNGDKVFYPECFGDKELVFIGMAHGLKFNNDCAVLHGGEVVPVRYSGLVRVENKNKS